MRKLLVFLSDYRQVLSDGQTLSAAVKTTFKAQ